MSIDIELEQHWLHIGLSTYGAGGAIAATIWAFCRPFKHMVGSRRLDARCSVIFCFTMGYMMHMLICVLYSSCIRRIVTLEKVDISPSTTPPLTERVHLISYGAQSPRCARRRPDGLARAARRVQPPAVSVRASTVITHTPHIRDHSLSHPPQSRVSSDMPLRATTSGTRLTSRRPICCRDLVRGFGSKL